MNWTPFLVLIIALLFWFFISYLKYMDKQESKAWRAKIDREIAEDKELIRQLREKKCPLN